MKKTVQYLMMLVLSLMATSCYYDELPAEVIKPLPAKVSYEKDIQPLWNQYCVSCHTTGKTAPDLTAANSYAAIMNNSKYIVAGNASGSFYFKLMDGTASPIMPPPGTTFGASNLALVEKWINDGAINN